MAFALGGLAGNNAHGAGFLQASVEAAVEPVMISCTSGQIRWLYDYLCLRNGTGRNLREFLRTEIEQTQPFRNRNLDLATIATFGAKGVFRPAYAEVVADTFRNAIDTFMDVQKKGDNVFVAREFLQLFPCRMLVPDSSEDFFESVSDLFLKSDIGIVFNSYNPPDGHENVYLNDAARELLHSTSRRKSFQPGNRNPTYRDRTTYQAITPQAIREGLWLYQYGFDQKDNIFLDGAYFREIILSELTYADTGLRRSAHQFPLDGTPADELPRVRGLEDQGGLQRIVFGRAISDSAYQ